MRSRLLSVTALATLLATACDPTPLTQVTVVVDAEGSVRDAAATFEARVYDDALELVEAQALNAAFPHEVVAYQVEDDAFVMELLALDAGGDVVARDVVSVVFAPERVKVLELRLHPRPAACPATCAPDARCEDGRCEPAPAIDAATLPDLQWSAP